MIEENRKQRQSVNQGNTRYKTKYKYKRRSRIGRRTKEMVGIAKNRIDILLSHAEAEIVQNRNIPRATRYVELARKIGKRYNVRIGKYHRHKICRGCNAFLGGADTCRVRIQGRKIIITCKSCGKIIRIPIYSRGD